MRTLLSLRVQDHMGLALLVSFTTYTATFMVVSMLVKIFA